MIYSRAIIADIIVSNPLPSAIFVTSKDNVRVTAISNVDGSPKMQIGVFFRHARKHFLKSNVLSFWSHFKGNMSSFHSHYSSVPRSFLIRRYCNKGMYLVLSYAECHECEEVLVYSLK